MNDTDTPTKPQQRAAARAQRDALRPQEVAERSARIHARLHALAPYRDATAVLSYVAFRNEVDTAPLLRAALQARRPVWVPWLDAQGMHWAPIASEADLVPGAHGILEPRPATRIGTAVPPDAVVLTPCLQFAVSGHRLGYGGGYFDRFLAGFGGCRIALAYDFQRNDALPVEAHDVAVDYVVTESETFRCRPIRE